MCEDISTLQRRIQELESKLREATEELQNLKARSVSSRAQAIQNEESEQRVETEESGPAEASQLPLQLDEYERYGRQLIMPEIGVRGQLNLKSSSVLIVGAGGLGCPAAAYLAGAGVGCLGIVDGDQVEVSNLHRQILHKTSLVKAFKAESIVSYVQSLNPSIRCQAIYENLSPLNVLDIVPNYDMILDCTDNPSSRYLISDAAVVLGKPVISASALRTEGQLVVLNHPTGAPGDCSAGPCYRCIFPNPPPPETVMSCGEGGILGPVVGVMGVLQALEAIKILASKVKRAGDSHNGECPSDAQRAPSLVVFNAYNTTSFRKVKLRGRRKNCRCCSQHADIDHITITSTSKDYLQYCAIAPPPQVLSSEERVRPSELADRLRCTPAPLIVDVREKAHFDVFSVPESINIPFSELMQWEREEDSIKHYHELTQNRPMHILCRLGNDSQLAVKKFKDLGLDWKGQRYIGDVQGGWHAWRREVVGLWPEF